MNKIAFVAVNQAAPWGGSEELWSQTALRLVQEGIQVGVSVRDWRPSPAPIQQLAQAGCQMDYRWISRKLVYKVLLKLSDKESFYRWLDRFQPDLVVISQGINFDGLGWMEACLQRCIPYVVITHCAAECYWFKDDVAARLVKGYQGAQRSFFVSHANLHLTCKQIAAELPNASVVRNPFKLSYDAAPPWADPQDAWRLACVGRLEPISKGQDVLFEVLRLEKWRDRPLRVTLFGNGSNQQSLMRLKELWGLENVEFGEYVNDIESIWKTHHGLILPSRYEGLPLAAVEAMLCGRICIVTDVAGNAELVQDGITGFIAKAPTVELLDEALERAWAQRETWYEMGQVGANQVRQIIPRDPIGVFAEELKTLVKIQTTA